VGDSTHTRRTEPTPVFGGQRFASITAGGASCHGHTCGIAPDGKTYCWGRNYQRALNGRDLLNATPALLEDDPGLETVVVGGRSVCGIRSDGALYCWGDGGYGQVGDGSMSDIQSPTPIRPDLRFASVSSGQYHTCGVTLDGPTYCWGSNSSDMLGNASNGLGWTVPVPVWRP